MLQFRIVNAISRNVGHGIVNLTSAEKGLGELERYIEVEMTVAFDVESLAHLYNNW